MLDSIKKFIKSSALMERAALGIFERMPLSLRYILFYGPTLLHWSDFLRECEQWDKENLETYQFKQLKNLLVHANKNVPYYRKLFPLLDFHPEKIQSLDDVKALPYLSKELVRDRVVEFVDDHVTFSSLLKQPTSGSTGIPMTIYRTKETLAAYYAFRGNLLGRIGHTLKSREVTIWAMISLGRKVNLPFVKYGNKLVLSIRYLTEEWLFEYSHLIKEFNPEFISGHPSALTLVSSFFKRNKLAPPENLRFVISYAETLYDWQRRIIEEALGVRIFSMYAATESSAIAAECEYTDSLHFHPVYGLIELADAGPGYEEIVATGFTNHTMPFIRYRTGDLVKGLDEFCPKCCRHHKIAASVEGRVQDFLIGVNGEIIPRLMPWIKTFPNVLQLQFFQEEPGRAYLKIVRDKTYIDKDTQYIKERLGEMLGLMKDRIEIEIVFVSEIMATSSGKLKMVEQRLAMKDFLMT